jgi:putative hydrolase of HD superfamily
MEKDIEHILDFLREARKFQLTYRFTLKPDGRFESDAEHSWAVALACMLLKSRLEEEFGQKLDGEKMLKMALVHDIAEIKTGDTKTWDTKARVNKEEKERKAIQGLASKLPEDLREELVDVWEEVEARESLEAKIVKSIDRFDPVLHRTFHGVGWSNVAPEHETVDLLNERQLYRHGFSKLLTKIFETVRDETREKGMLK